MKINKILEKIGLNKKEALVYEASLELANGTVQQIAIKANLPKSTVHDILKSLIKKGLVNIYLKGKKRFFTASDPGILEEKIKNQQKTLEHFLPEIKAIYNLKQIKPQVRYYEAKLGVGIVIKEILKEAKELLAIASAEDIFSKLADYFPEFAQERLKKRIPLRAILRDSLKAQERKILGPQELRQVKIIKTAINFNSLVWLWGNKVALVTLKNDLMVIVIDSQEIADTFRAIFELLWSSKNTSVGLPGIEPGLHAPEACVIPLYHNPI